MEEDSGPDPEGKTITKSQDEWGTEVSQEALEAGTHYFPYVFVNDRVEVGIPVDRIQLFGEEHRPAINEHEGQLIAPDPVATLNKALLLLEQQTLLQMDQVSISTNVEQARSRPLRWSPPPKGWLKVNVEAINLKHMMAMGAVVREDNGHALVAISASYEPEKDGLTPKAVALNRALSHGEDGVIFPHQKVVVELTSGLIVECLAEFETVRSVLSDVLRESLENCLSIASHFSEMKFAKVSAQQNRLAYCLASKALLQECEQSWVTFDTPDWLKEAISADLPD